MSEPDLGGRGERFRAALEAIDAANAGDPETVVIDGEALPKELTHARLMCSWVLRLDPGASHEQLLAARAHHLRRWELPRADFPEGRSGYLRWRTEQKKRHAALVGDLLRDVGYDDEFVDRVGSIVRKQGLSTDPAVQTHEDALCLVFLDTQFGSLADQLGDDKMVEVLAKTMRKMSPVGLAATAALELDDDALALIGRAAASLEDGSD